jgi:hypothetical protein
MPSYEEKMEAAALADEEAAQKSRESEKSEKRSSDPTPGGKIFIPCRCCGRKFNHLIYATHVMTCQAMKEVGPQVQQGYSLQNAGHAIQAAQAARSLLPQNRISERELNRLDAQAAVQQATLPHRHSEQQIGSGHPILLPHRHSSGYFNNAYFNVAAQAAMAETAARQASETTFAPQQGGMLQLSQEQDRRNSSDRDRRQSKQERRGSSNETLQPKHVQAMLSRTDYGKGEWAESYSSLHAEVDWHKSAKPARKIAKWTLNKLSENTLIMNTNIREHMIDIVKDAWWCTFLGECACFASARRGLSSCLRYANASYSSPFCVCVFNEKWQTCGCA